VDPHDRGQSSPSGPAPASSPYGQQAPVSNPYAQQPPVQPYGQQPYGQSPGPQYGGYGQQSYSNGPPQTNSSAIVLTVVSAVTMLSTCVIGIPSLIFGIMALTSNSTDPAGSRKKAKTGWIIFAVNVGVVVLLAVVAVIALFAYSDASSPGTF
jgi:hypothetical protein